MVERAEVINPEAIRLEKVFLNSPERLVEELAEDMEWDAQREVFRFPQNPHRIIKITSNNRNRIIRLSDDSNRSHFTLMQAAAYSATDKPWRYVISLDAWTLFKSEYEGRNTMKQMTVLERLRSPSIVERYLGPFAATHHEFSYSFPESNRLQPTLHNGAGFDTLSSSYRDDLEGFLAERYSDSSPYYLVNRLPQSIDGFATMRNFFTNLAQRNPSAPLLVPEKPRELA